MLPFFFGALAIGIIFTKYVENIGVYYFANMVGSGIGGIAAVFLMWIFFPEKLPAVLATLAFFSGILIVPKQIRSGFSIIIVIAVAVLTFIYINSPRLILSEYKSLSKALNLPGTKVVRQESSPYGLLSIISSNHIRYAPGLSITYPHRILVENAVFNNGDWVGPLTHQLSDSANYFEYSTEFLPYIINKRKNVLILEAGTGRKVQQALLNDAESITAVEQNKALMESLARYQAPTNDLIYSHPLVKIKNMHPRTFLLATFSKYDLITLPIVGAFGGTSGIYALREQYLLTKEAFNEMFSKLNSNGVICLNTWIDYPYKNPLKILTIITEMLHERGIKNYTKHIAAIKNWNTITFIVKRNQITENEIEIIRAFCTNMKFDPLILSDIDWEEADFYNRLQDKSLYSIIDKILASQKAREELYSEYQFNIEPSTDDKPYFSQFLQLKSIPKLAEYFGSQSVAFFEIGLILLYVTFFQIVILSIVLIITPLFKFGWKNNNPAALKDSGQTSKLRTLTYFSGIGLGYMFIEIILIQRFTLYFGNIIYAAAAVVGLMLVSSGLGSLVSQKIQAKRNRLIGIVILILFLLIFYTALLSSLLNLTIIFSLPVKIIFATLLIAPAAFLMGMPFPIGLRILATSVGSSGGGHIPWAWGINGLFSVTGAVLAVIIAVELGFVWVMLFAIGAYGMVMVSKLGTV
jgi:spermidine synthase